MRLSSKSHNFVNLNLIYKGLTRVPAIIITRPMLDFTDSFSLKTMYEKTIETQLCLTYQSAQLHLQDRLARPYSNIATNRLSQRLKGRCRQVRFGVLLLQYAVFLLQKQAAMPLQVQRLYGLLFQDLTLLPLCRFFRVLMLFLQKMQSRKQIIST